MIGPNTLLQNRYLVLNQIGQGGMGAVYIATDQRFGSTVALKETFFDDPSLRKAFEREARLLNHLRHPALPRVSDHFTEDEGQFLVMEYIAGDDLAEKLKERGGAFPLSEVLNWADQLLDALDYLHTQEPTVIHRDIKPQNLKLTPRNHIVLLDFGLAKGTPAMQISKVTATGSVFGYSRHYAPLEQIQGTGTDPRSDLYSLGATLYHLMTGITPPDALTRATAVLNGQPDPLRPASEVHAQVTPAVAEVINKAMAQNASQRPQTAAAMREALREGARQGLSEARDTKAQPSPSTNLYEQETQLIYAAAPQTDTGEAANKTGATNASDGATVAESASPSVAPAPQTNVEPESVVTKVASASATKSQSRRRAIAIGASAAVLIALAAVVYTFTRNPSQTPPASNESVQTAPTASPTTDAANQNNATAPAEMPTEAGKSANASATPPVTTRHTNPLPAKPTKENPAPERAPNDEGAQTGEVNDPPEPPGPDEMAIPQRPGRRKQPPMNNPAYDEAMRMAEERRRAAEEQRREALEQRREILRQQRTILGEELRRRKQQQRRNP